MTTYLDTLRRIPEDIMLAIFAHEFDECDGNVCICGWAVRENLARLNNSDAEDENAYDQNAPEGGAWNPPARCAQMFGGEPREWQSLYSNAASNPDVEAAVVDRLNEIVAVHS